MTSAERLDNQDLDLIRFLMEIDARDPVELRQELAEEIAGLAEVRNPATGYIFCRELNFVVDDRLLWKAAMVAKKLFVDKLPPELYPDIVVGVSNKGKEFATILGSLLGLRRTSISDRDGNQTDDEEEFSAPSASYEPESDQVVIRKVRSFTKKKVFDHFLFGVRPGDKVLVVDDFCAHGNITKTFWATLQDLNIVPTFVYIAAKDLPFLDPPQVGYREIREQGISAFPVVIFNNIQDGKAVATAEDINV